MGKRGRRREREQARNELHIVVCGGTSSTLESLLVQLRAAVLYGDRITVCSPTMSFLGDLAAMAELSDDDMARMLIEIAIASGQAPSSVRGSVAFAREYARRSVGAGDLAEARERLTEQVHAQLSERGADDVVCAIDAGLVEIERIDMTDPERGLDQFVRRIRRLLRDPLRYPLFAEDVADLARTMTNDDKRFAGGLTQVGLASGFMAKLPTFPSAPMDELIEIREVLRPPLVTFRAEMVRLADSLGSTPLDEDFEHHVRDAWKRDVEPALVELDALIDDNGLIRAYGGPVAKYGGLGSLMAGIVTENPSVATVCGLAAVAGGAAVRGAEQRHQHRRTLNSSPYYFLHQLDDRL